MSSFVLKIIALISMLFDHAGYIIMDGSSCFNYIGRIAFPIFAFQISEGYSHTKNIYKYLFRLFIFAIISQIPFMLFEYAIGVKFSLNIFFTLFFGLLSILIYDKIKFKFLGILSTIIIACIANYCSFDYGFYGIAIIFLFYIFRNNKKLMCFSFIIAVFFKTLFRIYMYGFYTSYLYSALFTIPSLIFICLYNSKKGKHIKYLLYIFYPTHLLLLYLISIFI